MFFANLVANSQRCYCTYFSCARESAAKFSSAVAAGTSSFRLYYSLVFDDFPRAQCQQASTRTGSAGGSGGGPLVRLLTCSSIFEPQPRATTKAGKFLKYLQDDTRALLLVIHNYNDDVM